MEITREQLVQLQQQAKALTAMMHPGVWAYFDGYQKRQVVRRDDRIVGMGDTLVAALAQAFDNLDLELAVRVIPEEVAVTANGAMLNLANDLRVGANKFRKQKQNRTAWEADKRAVMIENRRAVFSGVLPQEEAGSWSEST